MAGAESSSSDTFITKVQNSVSNSIAAECAESSLDNNLRRPHSENYGPELFLTPYLEAGKYVEARAACKVQNLSLAIESYSGYLTVNKTYNSNLFFWFFPAIYERETAPLILWLQGGPGSSSLIGLFSENGPIYVDDGGNLQYREIGSWARTNSMLYIDNPVGAGFSFTDHDEGYATNQKQICDALYTAICQFYQIFPELRPNALYLAGQSYAGKYIPTLGLEIHIQNHHGENADVDACCIHHHRINFKGCIIGSSFTDPYVQIDWGEYLHNMGLIDESEKYDWDSNTKEMRDHIETGNYMDAFQIMQRDIFGFPPLQEQEPTATRTTTYTRMTGLSNAYSIIEQDHASYYFNYRKWLAKPFTRASIHVGTRNLDFGSTKTIVFMKLAEDIPQSTRPALESLLNARYEILLYGAQFDATVPPHAIERLINSSHGWTRLDEFKTQGKKEIWKVCGGKVAGWRKVYLNLSYYFIRNAGHMAITDQPDWTLNMITQFIANDRNKNSRES